MIGNKGDRKKQYTIDELRERIAKVKAYAAEHGVKQVTASRLLGITQYQLNHAMERVKEHDRAEEAKASESDA